MLQGNAQSMCSTKLQPKRSLSHAQPSKNFLRAERKQELTSANFWRPYAFQNVHSTRTSQIRPKAKSQKSGKMCLWEYVGAFFRGVELKNCEKTPNMHDLEKKAIKVTYHLIFEMFLPTYITSSWSMCMFKGDKRRQRDRIYSSKLTEIQLTFSWFT